MFVAVGELAMYVGGGALVSVTDAMVGGGGSAGFADPQDARRIVTNKNESNLIFHFRFSDSIIHAKFLDPFEE